MTDIEQFIKYVISGGLSALTWLILLWIGVEFVSLPKTLSSFIGFCVGSTVNYSLQHRYVFKKYGNHGLFLKRYIVVTGFIFLCNYIINSTYTFMNPS